jgi:hypothetical protein
MRQTAPRSWHRHSPMDEVFYQPGRVGRNGPGFTFQVSSHAIVALAGGPWPPPSSCRDGIREPISRLGKTWFLKLWLSSDAANLELYLVFSGACDPHATWYESVHYWGIDGKRGSATATATDTYTLPTGTTSSTMTFHVPLPITALAPGMTVDVGGYAQDDENWRMLDGYFD